MVGMTCETSSSSCKVPTPERTWTTTPTTTPTITNTPTRTPSLSPTVTNTPTRTPTFGVDSFKCYNIDLGTRPDLETTVPLADRFETKATLIKRATMYCAPVGVNGAAAKLPDNNLTCYTIEDNPGPPGQPSFGDANVTSQIDLAGPTPSMFSIDRSQMICVPSRLK